MNLPLVPDLKTAAVVALVVGVAAFTGGYKVAEWRLTSKANAEALERAKGAEKARDVAIAERDALADRLAAANDSHVGELRNAQNETNRLRDRLGAGAVGLRIATKCPGTLTPAQSTPGALVDTGARAELDPTTRRAYFALRDGIDRTSAQLAACQDELRLRAAK